MTNDGDSKTENDESGKKQINQHSAYIVEKSMEMEIGERRRGRSHQHRYIICLVFSLDNFSIYLISIFIIFLDDYYREL
jgi:hypothetical protein